MFREVKDYKVHRKVYIGIDYNQNKEIMINNNQAISPVRQIAKRLTQKMKEKRLKLQRAKLLKHNRTQLKNIPIQDSSIKHDKPEVEEES